MKYNFTEIITIAGVFMALNIGAGFASGQEIAQFFSGYGMVGFLGGLISFCVLLFSCESIIDAGWVHRFCIKTSVFEYFCGRKIGNVYSVLIPIALYGNFVIMISGVGGVLEEFFMLPSFVGRTIVLVLIIGSIFFDFMHIAKIISKLGKIVATIIIIICFIVIFKKYDNWLEGITLINNIEIISAGHTYYLAGILYAGSIVLASAQFLFEYGRTISDRRDALYGIVLGVLLFISSAMIINVAILIYIEEVSRLKIITLFFAQQISFATALLMAFLIPVVMASSSVSIFWSIGSIIRKKTSISQKVFYIINITMAVLGYFLAQIPFDRLINILYPINGLLGVSFIGFIIIKNRIMARHIHS